MTIRDHKYNELYKKKQQLVQELQVLNKNRGGEQEKKDLKKQLIQAEKKFNQYLKKRESSYPNCAYCSQKVAPSCLMVDGCPRNYHNECWIKSRKEVKRDKSNWFEEQRERDNNPFLFAKVEGLERELAEIKKSLSK